MFSRLSSRNQTCRDQDNRCYAGNLPFICVGMGSWRSHLTVNQARKIHRWFDSNPAHHFYARVAKWYGNRLLICASRVRFSPRAPLKSLHRSSSVGGRSAKPELVGSTPICASISGYGAVWQHACLGSKRSQVQILLPRPYRRLV